MVASVLKGSVGQGGQNQRPDVQLVQKLLNAVPTGRGGPMPALVVDGLCGPKTCGAIRRFQSVTPGLVSDGRIDVNRNTEKALLALLQMLGLLASLLGPGANVRSFPQPTIPGSGGPGSPVRQRYLAAVRSLVPASGLSAGSRPTDKNGNPVKGTNCGELPGFSFRAMPVKMPTDPSAFRVRPKGVTLFLTSPTTWWEEMALEIDRVHGSRTWVPFSGGLPLPGDIYLLKMFDKADFQHVGVILNVGGSTWETADAGQGNGWQKGIQRRTFKPDGEITGEFGNKARVKGWVNLDALYAVAKPDFQPAGL